MMSPPRTVSSYLTLFTLTPKGRFKFLWYFPYPHGRSPLTTTVPCAARTFLSRSLSSDRLSSSFSLYPTPTPESTLLPYHHPSKNLPTPQNQLPQSSPLVKITKINPTPLPQNAYPPPSSPPCLPQHSAPSSHAQRPPPQIVPPISGYPHKSTSNLYFLPYICRSSG